MPDSDAHFVDKSMVVIGGFAADALDDAKNHAGHASWCRCKVDMAGAKKDIALASFEIPQRAMKLIHSQRTNPAMNFSLGC